MRPIIFLVVFTAIVGCSTPPDGKDVAAFLDRREMCDHFRGEISGEPGKRNDELIESANKYCTGTDAQLKALKTRYAGDPAVMAKLNELEEKIEP